MPECLRPAFPLIAICLFVASCSSTKDPIAALQREQLAEALTENATTNIKRSLDFAVPLCIGVMDRIEPSADSLQAAGFEKRTSLTGSFWKKTISSAGFAKYENAEYFRYTLGRSCSLGKTTNLRAAVSAFEGLVFARLAQAGYQTTGEKNGVFGNKEVVQKGGSRLVVDTVFSRSSLSSVFSLEKAG